MSIFTKLLRNSWKIVAKKISLSNSIPNCLIHSSSGSNKALLVHVIFVDPSLANVLISHLLKNPENLRFSGVFRDYEMETLDKKGLSLFGILHHISEPLQNDEIKFEPQVFIRWELGTKEYCKLIQSLDGK